MTQSMATDLTIVYIALLVNGFTMAGRAGLTYVFMMESVPASMNKSFSVGALMLDASAFGFLSLICYMSQNGYLTFNILAIGTAFNIFFVCMT